MATEERLDASQPPATPAGPGAQLQAARQAAGLSLEQVAAQLKLAPRQVRALEEEDFAQLPGRTFARGFVRNYARLLNLDGDLLLAGLPDSARAPALEAPALQSTGAMIAELPRADRAQPGLSRWVIPIVLVACIVAAAIYEWYRGALAPPGEAQHAALSLPVAPAATTSTELANPLAAEAKAEAEAPAPRLADPGPAAPSAAPAPESAAVPAPSVAAADSPAPLQLTYHGPSWTEIRDRDGQVLISRLVTAGSEQTIRGSAPFDIVIGNANEVTLVYRGAQVDLSRYTRQNVARLRLT